MYQPPSVGPQGLTIPSYQDILNYLTAQFQAIYGSNVYLENDAADHQWISVVALKFNDAMKALQLDYNSRGPSTANGSALDSIVKLSGIARKPATYSSCSLNLAGVANTLISNGVVQDQNGYYWNLPASVLLNGSGLATVTAVCQTIGPIVAGIGTINIISTIVAGWNTVTNSVIAVPGAVVESDSALRGRQAISTALPSITTLAGTIAGLYATPEVTRLNVIENPTGSNDEWGNPPHSITCVVEGGVDLAVATTIYNNRGIGCYTNGTDAQIVIDPNSSLPNTIRFDRPTYVQPTLVLNVHLINGTSATIAAIKSVVVAYLNSLEIGETLTVSGIYAAALALVGNISLPMFSIHSITIGYTNIVTALPTISAAGTGYVVGDVLYIAQSGSSLGAAVTVTTINGSGGVTGIALFQNGTDYTSASGVATSGETGSGATLTIVAGSGSGSLDLGVAFNEVTQGVIGNVTVNSI